MRRGARAGHSRIAGSRAVPVDPLADKRRKVPTFKEAARRTFEANKARWRGRTAHDWEQMMGRHILPALGGKPVDRIGREDVLRVLTPIFPSPKRRGKPLSDRALARILTAGWPTARRCTASDRPSGIGVRIPEPREVAEAALAHVVGGVEGA